MWDPAQFEGIDTLHYSTSRIWTPDIRLYGALVSLSVLQGGPKNGATLLRTRCVTCSARTSSLLNQTCGRRIAHLNPVDFAVWGALQQIVYDQQRFDSVDKLKRAIVKARDKLSQAFLNRSIGEWRRRLAAVVQQNGGHIEHKV